MTDEDEDEDEDDADFLREAARAEINVLNETRQLVLEQHSHSFKWLTASLLAINGGGAIAILNSDALEAIWKVRAGGAFALGILFALLVAVAAQKLSIRSLLPIQRQIGYWMTVVQDGSRLEEFEKTLGEELRGSMRFAWVIPGLGWVSGLFFAFGLMVSANGVLQAEQGEQNSNNSSSVKKVVSRIDEFGVDTPHLTPRRQTDDADAALRPKTLTKFVGPTALPSAVNGPISSV